MPACVALPFVVAQSPDEHLVTSLPELKDGDFPSRHHAGHIPVVNGFFFYWLIESASKDPASEPLVIWLNGGPGCSSMDGLWLENGPFRLNADQEISINPFSWHNVANVMYVDQPVGTGLSFTTSDSYANNDVQVDEQFYVFLTNFFDLHSQFKARDGKTRPLFFTGESHAGHYIPSMISYILGRNKAAVEAGEGGLVMDVQGMAIGNGWVDPVSQYDVSDFAFGVGLIDVGQRRALKKKEETCINSIKSGNFADHTCMALMDAVVAGSGGKEPGVPRVSMYDVREYEVGRKFPPGHKIVEAYLNRDDVREAIHASGCPASFKECSDKPFFHLAKWDGLGVTNEVRTVLNANIRSLFFNGQYDLICNHVGNQKALMNLKDWEGAERWEASRRGVWLSDGKGADDKGHRQPLGYAKVSWVSVRTGRRSGCKPTFHPLIAFVGDNGSSPQVVEYGSGLATVGTVAAGAAGGGGALGALLLAPDIVGVPRVGRDSAVVEFTMAKGEGQGFEEEEGGGGVKVAVVLGGEGSGGEVGGGGEGAGLASRVFEVRSSPGGLVGGRACSREGVHFRRHGGVFGGGGGEGGEGAEVGGGEGEGKSVVRSSPSIGSAVVTPGCGQILPSEEEELSPQRDRTADRECSGRGVCKEGGEAGLCVCENGYGGEMCGVLLAGAAASAVAGGSGGGAEMGRSGGGLGDVRDGDIKMLLDRDIAVLAAHAQVNDKGIEVGVQFFLRPGVFRDPEFVFAIQTIMGLDDTLGRRLEGAISRVFGLPSLLAISSIVESRHSSV
eukprot:jgi/Undpi1/7498/HiC_scaffold_22.g09971.m1